MFSADNSTASTIRVAKATQPGERFFLDYGRFTTTLRKLDLKPHIADGGETFELANATLVPLTRVALGQFSGGVSLTDDAAARLVLTRGFADQSTRANAPENGPHSAQRRLERAWFGGYAFDHFGHFLLEGLSRVASPELLASADPVIFFDPMRIGKPRGYMAGLFNAVGLDPARVAFCNHVTQVGRLLCCEPAIEIRGRVRPRSYEVFHKNAGVRAKASGRKSGIVYLSRSRLQGRRSIEGEAELEQWLAEQFGARIVYPELLSVDEQLSLQANSAVIVGCEGSALHLPILLGTSVNLVLLTTAKVNLNYFLCDEVFPERATISMPRLTRHRSQTSPGHWTSRG